VISLLSRSGGKGAAHAWQANCVTIGHLSYVSVQVFEQQSRCQFRAIPRGMAHHDLQTSKYAHISSHHFLLRLPSNACTPWSDPRQLMLDPEVFGIFEQLQDGCPRILAAIKTLTARRKAKGQTSQVVEDVSDIDEDEGPGGSKAQ
ncbi:hypothetical protein C8Q72DRAFT_776157, partial [Fomitopsis betulina]